LSFLISCFWQKEFCQFKKEKKKKKGDDAHASVPFV
jgi:hypothetical protein